MEDPRWGRAEGKKFSSDSFLYPPLVDDVLTAREQVVKTSALNARGPTRGERALYGCFCEKTEKIFFWNASTRRANQYGVSFSVYQRQGNRSIAEKKYVIQNEKSARCYPVSFRFLFPVPFSSFHQIGKSRRKRKKKKKKAKCVLFCLGKRCSKTEKGPFRSNTRSTKTLWNTGLKWLPQPFP